MSFCKNIEKITESATSLLEPNSQVLQNNQFLEAMRFRHACKIFDKTKKIPTKTTPLKKKKKREPPELA